MPSYIYEDQKTQKVVEVIRSFSEYQVPPTREEVGADLTDEEYSQADWLRLLRHPSDTKSHRTYIQPVGKGWDTPGSWSR